MLNNPSKANAEPTSITTTMLVWVSFSLFVCISMITPVAAHASDRAEGILTYRIPVNTIVTHPGGTATREAHSKDNVIRLGLPGGEIQIEYSMWTLMGSSVWRFKSLALIEGDLRVYRNGRLVMRIRQHNDQSIRVTEQRPMPYMLVLVPQDVWKKARVTQFNFMARVNLPFTHNIHIRKSNPGVMSQKQGEWGWDTPGNPPWNRMFTTSLQKIEKPSLAPEGHWLNEESSKRIFKELLESSGQRRPLLPISGGVWNIHLSTNSLFEHIRREAPEAFKYYYSSPRNEQLDAMLHAYMRVIENNMRQDGIIEVSPELKRLGDSISRFATEFREDLNPEMLLELEQLNAQVELSSFEAKLIALEGKVSEFVASNNWNDERLEQVIDLFPVDGVRMLNHLQSESSRLRNHISENTRSRLHAIESILEISNRHGMHKLWLVIKVNASENIGWLYTPAMVFGSSSDRFETRREREAASARRRELERRINEERSRKANEALRKSREKLPPSQVWGPHAVWVDETLQEREVTRRFRSWFNSLELEDHDNYVRVVNDISYFYPELGASIYPDQTSAELAIEKFKEGKTDLHNYVVRKAFPTQPPDLDKDEDSN